MIRIWPRSLFGRNLLLLAATIILSVTLSFISAYVFILNAQTSRLVGIGATMLNSISSVAYDLPADARADLVENINRSRYLHVLPLGVIPETGRHRANAFEKMLMQRLIDQLEFQTELEWRVGTDRTVWLRLRIGAEYYWIAARAPAAWTPLRWLVFILLVIIVVVTLIGAIATRQISRPLASLKQETDRLSLGSDRGIAEVNGPTEITSLSKSFKLMTERLRESEAIRAETLAELSHDLRTPLARLRLAVEMMDETDDLKTSATRQIHLIDGLIGQFMDYARGAKSEQKAEFDLSTLIEELSGHYGIEADIAEATLIQGQKEYVRRAIINLVENARKYGAPPIRLSLSKDKTHAVVEVRDMGEGFDPGDSADMLKSFRRGTHATHISGSGLGLTIVDRAAAAHDGEIQFTRYDPTGFGARLSLALSGQD